MPAEVKICGLSTPETVEAAIAAGADFVGLCSLPRARAMYRSTAARDLAGIARGRARIVTSWSMPTMP